MFATGNPRAALPSFSADIAVSETPITRSAANKIDTTILFITLPSL
jgi:hypothetical protein